MVERPILERQYEYVLDPAKRTEAIAGHETSPKQTPSMRSPQGGSIRLDQARPDAPGVNTGPRPDAPGVNTGRGPHRTSGPVTRERRTANRPQSDHLKPIIPTKPRVRRTGPRLSD